MVLYATNMSYLDMVNEAQHDAHATGPVSAESLDYALALKQPHVIEQIADRVSVSPQYAGLRSEHRDILHARELGNQLVRVGVASELATQVDGRLLKLRPDDGSAHYKLFMDEYARAEVFGQVLHRDRNGELPEVNISNDEVIQRIAETKLAGLSVKERNQFRLAYANVVPGSFPSRRWYEPAFGHNDVTLTQAFGRNSITDAELPEQVVQRRATAASDEAAFVSLSRDDFDPGESNYSLAEEASTQLQDPTRNLDQIMQWEVAYALWETEPEVFHAYRPAIHVVWPTSDFYPTHEVKADSIAVMKEKGLFNPYEFAHPDMMIRAAAILSKQGVQADVLPRDIPYDPDSAQPWTRDRSAWMPREFAARAEHLLRGRVAAPRRLKKPKPGDHDH